MKALTFPALFALLATVHPAAFAEEKKTEATVPASEADAAWAVIEKAMRGPSEQPKSREEAMTMMKANISKIDGLAEDFTTKYPTDPRRWKIAIQLVSSYQIRQIVGLPAKSPADARGVLEAVLAAPDADPETKAIASFTTVITFGDELKTGKITLAEFEKAVEAHRKAYPDFKGNSRLQTMVATAQSEQDIKKNPLDLKYTAVDGREVDLAKLRGKVVLVDFWATWCGPCVVEIPNVVKAYEKLHDKGFEIVGISFDQDKAKLEAMTKEKGMGWPQFFDGKGWKNEFGAKFGINSIPRMWLVNKKGMVVDTEGRAGLAEKVEKLLAE